MAKIEGSTTVDWAGVSLNPAGIEQNFVQFFERLEQLLFQIDSGQFFENQLGSTFIRITLFSGGTIEITGSNLLSDFPRITKFVYQNLGTGDVLRFTGALDGLGTYDSLTSMTLTFPGFSGTVNGNILINNFTDELSGTATSQSTRIGNATMAVVGSFTVSGTIDTVTLSGNVAGITVTGPGTGNTIKITGLSLPIELLDPVDSADDVLAIVGNNLPGNDTITYGNNSPVGMSFAGGGGSDAITITGPRNDTLDGGTGDDSLNGGLGDDSMTGGVGDDQFTLDTAADIVIENPAEGTDKVRLAYGGTAMTPAVVDLGTDYGGNVEHAEVTGTGLFNVTGNGADNILTGNASINVLTGLGGNDVLDGGAGNDVMAGGDGNDTYTLSAGLDGVIENPSEGTDTLKINFNVSTTVPVTIDLETNYANVENAQLIGTGLFNVTGNAEINTLTGNASNNVLLGGGENDVLTGNAGNDVLNGGAGNDQMTGNAGNDTYDVDSESDEINEAAGVAGGTDFVRSTAASFTLDANVEDLTLVAGGINGTGNTLANIITGNELGNDLSGDAGSDRLFGMDGIDELDGGAGKDSLSGGQGDDTYIVDGVSTTTYDTVTETALAGSGTDIVNFAGSGTYVLPVNVENLLLLEIAGTNGTGNALANIITGNSGSNVLSGLGADDSISGAGGNDTLDGGVGADTMVGGDGNDTFRFDTNFNAVTKDVVEETSGIGGGVDTAIFSFNNAGIAITITTGEGVLWVENVTVTGTGLYDIFDGSTVDDNLFTGNASANVLSGLGGDDNLAGNAGNDTLIGGDDNDTLDGGVGTDSMIGGNGNDTFTLSAVSDLVIEAFEGGTDTVKIAYNVAAATLINLGSAYDGFVENLQITGSGLFNLTGNDQSNILTGNAQANVLDGGLGNDVMYGGAGNDTYKVDSESDQANETIAGAAGGTDLVQSTAASYTLAANVERLTLMGGALNGTGNNLANLITGNELANTLDGGIGKDAYVGGMGDDTFVVDGVSAATYDTITDVGGTDTVHFGGTGTYVMPLPTDNLLLLESAGNANVTGTTFENVITGNGGSNALSSGASNDTLYGNAGNDTLDGGTGNDYLRGGTDDDLYIVDSITDAVLEIPGEGSDTVRLLFSANISLDTAFGGGVEHLQGAGTGTSFQMTGNTAGNRLSGGTLADTLTGFDGDDTLDGGAGNDTMNGGTGNDTYTLSSVNDLVIEADVEGGVDTVKIGYGNASTAAVTISLASAYGILVENLQIVGSGLFNLTGNGQNNILTGNASANIINGGTGADAMAGGGGNDTYFVDDNGDTVTETISGAAGGVDVVNSARESFTLDANVENLVLQVGGFNGTGNAGINSITGNDQNNILDGGAGKDVLNGGLGNDTYVVDGVSAATYDTVTDTGGTDTVNFGGSGTYVLGATIEHLLLLGTGNINGTGNASDNQLTGNSGNNILNGGLGNDTMIGGAGDDTYVFSGLGDLLTEILGEGNDTLRLAFNVSTPTDIVLQDTGGDAYDNIENLQATGTGLFNLVGDSENNVLTGNASSNTLSGGGGNDTLIGGAGSDNLQGGEGDDRLDGGGGAGLNQMFGHAGADSFVFSGLSTVGGIGGNDIGDFTVGQDKVLLDNDVFVGLAVGALNPAAFKVLASMLDPIDASDRIIYVNDGGGHLWYDANGSVGGSNFVPIATFFGSPNLSASDFLVID